MASVDNPAFLPFAVRMKNITVSVDDEIYHRARVRAAERRTSLSAIVREILIELAAEETEAERLSRQEDEIVLRLRERGSGYSAARRLTREEIHDRHALR
jgi:plasmid stability protein